MHRGIQPTIRLWSLIVRIRQVTVCRADAHACPGTYARRGSIIVWSLKGLSGGVMLRSWVRCDIVVQSANRKPAASRRPPLGGEAIERRPAPLTTGHCARESETSTVEKPIKGKCDRREVTSRSGRSGISTPLCQERVRPLFFPLARSRERRLNALVEFMWCVSTWRRKYLHRGWPGNPATPANSRPEAATGDGRP